MILTILWLKNYNINYFVLIQVGKKLLYLLIIIIKIKIKYLQGLFQHIIENCLHFKIRTMLLRPDWYQKQPIIINISAQHDYII